MKKYIKFPSNTIALSKDYVHLTRSGSKPYLSYLRHIGYKFSDNLEDLLDHFGIKVKGSHGIFGMGLEEAKEESKANPDIEIYGAVWTDKGLTYVAKMNDNGEFELL